MAPYLQRVLEEKEELDKKLISLSLFINKNDFFNSLDTAERMRLYAQRVVMTQYSDILSERILAFK